MSEDPWDERDCTFAECWDEGRWVTCWDDLLLLSSVFAKMKNKLTSHYTTNCVVVKLLLPLKWLKYIT